MSIAELAYLKLFDEKVNGNTPHYLKVFHASKRQRYFTHDELSALFGKSRPQTKRILAGMQKANAIKKEGCLYKAMHIMEIAAAEKGLI